MPGTEQNDNLRLAIRAAYLADETSVVRALVAAADLKADSRRQIAAAAADLVRTVRASSDPTMMENFLAEYGLSTAEGVALMCLAEALLRVPDAETIDALISDKIAPADWGKHLGRSSSSLVNASTWALMLTGQVVAPADESLTGALHALVRRLGEPVVRTAVGQVMREMGRQFVLGRSIEEAVLHAQSMEAKGYTYSYDMLGEAARTEADARRYHLAYSNAITALAPRCTGDVRASPGISVKLSALHPRYEFGQRDRVMNELVARVRSLASLARSANMGFNIDAEEADRLELSLEVIEAALSDPALAGWHGFGVVVQAYGPRASRVLEWLYALAERLDRRIMVRLVKGAYWDSEIKRAQVLGLEGFPVFTRKVNTDISYIACAKQLMAMTGRIYPQFATHNAHSVAAVLHMAKNREAFEFQRLHGMGEALHDAVLAEQKTRCRIYAPVGAHADLLAYLVRRLLENGANSSFVNQIVDGSVSAAEIARDPFQVAESLGAKIANPVIPRPAEIFGAGRRNAKGWDLTDPLQVQAIAEARRPFQAHLWRAGPMLARRGPARGPVLECRNPADTSDLVGHVEEATAADLEAALAAARHGFADWSRRPVGERAACLERLAELYEENAPEFFALSAREAGKSLPDGVGEVREAVDFLRYYAHEARRLEAEEAGAPRGIFISISPWNFPLAIFTGQIAAALAAGNAVIAKPAEQTPLIAARAVSLMHQAGLPEAAIQLLPGDGPSLGGPLTSDPRIAGVCFTGSTEVAQIINRAMAAKIAPEAPLIAETGGLNAMIVDSTALPEQAVRDIVASAFQSAGQRCSALRMLYVQSDVEERLLEMLFGAMDELRQGDPWQLFTDVGPVIDDEAEREITAYCGRMEAEGRLLKKLESIAKGHFVPPAVYRVSGIEEMAREVFGPILHVASFEADDIDAVIDAINARGYGLTFGLHTRVDARVQRMVDRIEAGNLYVNRNQIGAVVGSQPFGGEGLSGTGPKAGGPNYLRRFRQSPDDKLSARTAAAASVIAPARVQAALDRLSPAEWRVRDDRIAVLRSLTGNMETANALPSRALEAASAIDLGARDLPGPTGESNRLSLSARGVALCLGPDCETALAQAVQILALGGAAVLIAPAVERMARPLIEAGAPVAAFDGRIEPVALTGLGGFAVVASAAEVETRRALRIALAARDGELKPLISEIIAPHRYLLERHLCIDTTAAGGNASLLAAAD